MNSADHTTGGPASDERGSGATAPPGAAPSRTASPEPASSGGTPPESVPSEAVAPEDVRAVELQLGRPPRGLRAVAHRCPCGLPDVVRTAPRLEDGSPFPTLYYLTCPRANSAIGSLESGGEMRRMQDRLAEDPELRAAYREAHASYIAERDARTGEDGLEPLPRGMQSAGGMPERVKCLHALVAHELAAPGTNPFGREALDALPDWWEKGPCVCAGPENDDTSGGGRP